MRIAKEERHMNLKHHQRSALKAIMVGLTELCIASVKRKAIAFN